MYFRGFKGVYSRQCALEGERQVWMLLAVEMTAAIKHFIFLLGFIQMYIGVMKIKKRKRKNEVKKRWRPSSLYIDSQIHSSGKFCVCEQKRKQLFTRSSRVTNHVSS